MDVQRERHAPARARRDQSEVLGVAIFLTDHARHTHRGEDNGLDPAR